MSTRAWTWHPRCFDHGGSKQSFDEVRSQAGAWDQGLGPSAFSPALGIDHDLAELLVAHHVLEGLADFGEREAPVDYELQLAVVERMIDRRYSGAQRLRRLIQRVDRVAVNEDGFADEHARVDVHGRCVEDAIDQDPAAP